jgi:thiol-disulfide isomerase/thioredoxin
MKPNLPFPGRRAVVFGGFFLMTCLGLAGIAARADDSAPAATNSISATPNAEADKAWKETKKLTQEPMPPASWQEKAPTREEAGKYYLPFLQKAVDAAKDFYTRFPNHPKAEEAHKTELKLLTVAVNQFGDTNLAPRLEALEQTRMADPKLSEDERFQMRMNAIQRLFQGMPESLPELEKSARALQKDFPNRDEVYQVYMMILSNSEGDKARALAKEIIDGPAPDQAKEQAKGILKRLDAVGKPVDIAFTAVDGRAVDLTKMKGKVVLVDFWATWCGPCMGEVPHVKEAYEKLHDKGFEIVGISFDKDKDKLETTLKEKGMTWPQYFDGLFWKNKYGVQFGIESIPTMWLVDKNGNLRDVNARGELEEKVTKLLAE